MQGDIDFYRHMVYNEQMKKEALVTFAIVILIALGVISLGSFVSEQMAAAITAREQAAAAFLGDE